MVKKNIRHALTTIKLDILEDDDSVELLVRRNGLYAVASDRIIKIQNLETTKTSRENKSALFGQSIFLPLGSKDPFVSRTIIQSKELADIFLAPDLEEYHDFMDISWEVLSSIVSIRMIRSRLEKQILKIVDQIDNNIDLYTKGISPKPLPIIEYYDIEFRSFANEVRRVLSVISKLFKTLHNFECKSGHFHRALAWSEETRGKDSLLYQMLKNDLNWIEVWIDVRIAIEHPKTDRFVETFNFTLEPNRTIRLPTWRFVHPNYDMERPQNLLDAFENCINNILKFYEDMQVVLLDGKLPASHKVSIIFVDEEKRDPACPRRILAQLMTTKNEPAID